MGKVIFLGIVQEIEIWLYENMLYSQPRICPGGWDTQTPLGFWDRNESPNLSQMTRPSDNQQGKDNLSNCRLCCPGWLQNKIERK